MSRPAEEASPSRKELLFACYSRFRIHPSERPRPVRLAKVKRIAEVAEFLGEKELAAKFDSVFVSCAAAWLKVENLTARRREASRAARRMKSDAIHERRCAECGIVECLTVDHVVPISKGGSDERKNLRWLCWSCNTRKGAKFDAQAILMAYHGDSTPWGRSLSVLSGHILAGGK